MKGTQGLIIAVGLGIIGAVCNLLYLGQQARDLTKVAFVAVARDEPVELGDRFREEHFMKVDVPKENLGNLEQVAVLWQDRNTVVGLPATREYFGGELLLHTDLRTPARKDLSETLAADEALRWVPVDPRNFVAEHVNPGDRVSFVVPVIGGVARRSSNSPGNEKGPTETIGSFEVLALGTRKGRRDVLKAEGSSPSQEHLVGVRVSLEDGQLDPTSQRLFDALRVNNYQGVQIMLHSARGASSP